MRTILFLVQKEFLQIFRDKIMLMVIFVIPMIQLIILSHAATFELKKAPFHLVDFDQTVTSQRLVNTFTATDVFDIRNASSSTDRGIEDILGNRVIMTIVIPEGFEKDLGLGGAPEIQLLINAINANRAELARSYSESVLANFSRKIIPEIEYVNTSSKKTGRIQIIPSNRYNPELDYIIYMVPGIIVVLTTLLGLLLSVLNIVREKEIGTAEQMNVTPIKKYQFIAGKLIPAWVLVMTVISIGFLVALWVFDVPFRGNMSIVYFTAAVYLVGVLGLGLFISTQADTQQQSMHIIFFIFMVFMLLGGIFTPLESMPLWAQKSTLVNPIAYFGQIVRMVLLKGSGWGDLYLHIFALIVMAVIMVTAAVISYDKRAG